MRRKLVLLLAALPLIIFLLTSQAFAQMEYKAGFTERVRHEYWKNIFDMNTQSMDTGDRNFFRFKTSVWGRADYEELWSVYARLTNEFKTYTYYGVTSKGARGDIDEVVFDNLYFDLKHPADMPVTFRLGRQDLNNQYAENFLISDGTPSDGSRTFYFNALKASWEVTEKNTLDLVYINDPKNDDYLPIFNRNKTETALEASDETGFMVDLKNKSIDNLTLEPYYIYKHEGAGGGGLQTQTGKIHTVGAFTKYIADPWTFRAQLAGQTGDYGQQDREGLGGYAFVDRAFEDAIFAPVVTFGYLYLSGDDKNTAKNEGWDPLFSRTIAWSEIYYQSYKGESGAGYWTNLSMYRVQAAFKLTQKAKLALTYSFLRANELVPASSTYSFSGDGKNRGSLYQTKLDYAFTKNLTGYILGELFTPGNFYTDVADNAIFVRTELQYKF